MAEEKPDSRPKFPVIPSSHWWALRNRFKQSIPSVVDAKFVAATLGMSEGSARSNVLPALKTLGIINEDGTKTDLAVKWRSDDQYKAYCDEIRKKVYPSSLTDAAPDASDESKTVARRWFANHGVGESMLNKATQLYFLLCEANPEGANQKPPKSNAGGGGVSVKKAQPAKARKADDPEPRDAEERTSQRQTRVVTGPAVHLNVQIHISPEVTPDQIEAIFASMGKHLKNLSE